MLIHKKLWAELGTLKGFFLPYFLKWKIYAKTLKLTSCWVSSNKIKFVKSISLLTKQALPGHYSVLSQILFPWSKLLDPFCSQNGQISFQSCLRMILCWVLVKMDIALNISAIYRAIIYVMYPESRFFIVINFSVFVALALIVSVSAEDWVWRERSLKRHETVQSSTPARLRTDSFKLF